MKVDQRKIRILSKLAEHGADTEKKITALSFQEIMEICKDSKALAIAEIQLILEFQEAIKGRKAVAFLLNGKEEEEKKDARQEKGKDKQKHGGADIGGDYSIKLERPLGDG